VSDVFKPGPTGSTLAALDALGSLLSLNASIENARAGMSELFTVSANQVTEIAHETGHDPASSTVVGFSDGPAAGGPVLPGAVGGRSVIDGYAATAAARELKDSVIAFTAQHSGR
jgi:hypothetical protein